MLHSSMVPLHCDSAPDGLRRQEKVLPDAQARKSPATRGWAEEIAAPPAAVASTSGCEVWSAFRAVRPEDPIDLRYRARSDLLRRGIVRSDFCERKISFARMCWAGLRT